MRLYDRQDEGLAFMLKFENLAWYNEGEVRMLDRRIYPIKTEFVSCKTYKEVVKAIADMVTQSEGPYTAAAMAMALAAYEARDFKEKELIFFMEEAAERLATARPTTTKQMRGIVDGALHSLREGLHKGLSGLALVDEVFAYAYHYVNENYRKYTIIGRKLAELIPENGVIMTQCFAGTVIGTFLRECRRMGKEVKVISAETRPYYQGARLTASVACDMGFDVTVVSDNMTAYAMKEKKVDLFTSASDVITMDGHIINKIGTFQMALAAKHLGIPYYVTGTPDSHYETGTQVVIEERNPNLVLESLGVKLTMEGVKGYYPAFDITPPEFVTGIVTDKGVLSPGELETYFS